MLRAQFPDRLLFGFETGRRPGDAFFRSGNKQVVIESGGRMTLSISIGRRWTAHQRRRPERATPATAASTAAQASERAKHSSRWLMARGRIFRSNVVNLPLGSH